MEHISARLSSRSRRPQSLFRRSPLFIHETTRLGFAIEGQFSESGALFSREFIVICVKV